MEAEFNVILTGDQSRSPGPAAHCDKSHFGEGTKCAMRARLSRSEERFDPALVCLPSTIGHGPKYSLSGRHPELKKLNPPGPSYMPPAFGSGGRKCGFSRAARTTKVVVTPGPSDYTITAKALNTFGVSGQKTAVREGGGRKLWDTVTSPGPANYLPRYAKMSKSSPSWTIAHRYKEKKGESTGEYVGAPSTLGGRKCSMVGSARRAIVHR